jgi:hypothetical protein
MPDCWLEVGMHPAGPPTGQLDQDFCAVLLGPTANAELVPKFCVAVDAISRSSSHVNVNIKKFYQTFFPKTDVKIQIADGLQRDPVQFLSFVLHLIILSSLPNVLPSLQPTITRRTSGHCMGNFKAENNSSPPPPS